VNENVDIWALPIDAGQRAAAAEPKRLTTDANLDLFPALSGDGRTLAFTSRRSGNNDIWVKDLESAEETPIVTMPWDESRPALTRDARKIAYEIRPEPPKQSCQMITLGPTRRDAIARQALPDNCWRAWSWSSDGTKLLYLVVEGGHHVDLVDVVSGKSRTVLESPNHRFYHAYFSPDDRWVSFLASGRVAVAPYRDDAPLSQASWIFVTDGESAADKPRWSADGKRIYYTSNVDGFRCIWARNVDALTKQPLGSPFAVYHSHAARLSMLNVGLDAIELGVSEDKLVFPMTELTGNIWMTTVSQMK
jgi:Tol biopolymer transport system component